MKKLFAGIFATVLGLSCFSACNLLNQGNVTYDVESAADFLDATYIDQIGDGREDYDLLNTITFNNAQYKVEWSVEAEAGVVLVKGETTTKVDVDEASEKDIDYTLTATVSDPNGNKATVKFNGTLLKAKALIPVAITEKPVEGENYKLYVYNENSKTDCYFAGGIQAKYYLNSVEDYESAECVDVYVEYVEGSDTLFNLYFNHKLDGKQYVGIKENWNSTKGYWSYNPVIAGEPVSQFEYSTKYETIITVVDACSVNDEKAEQDTTKTIFWGNSGGTYTSIGGVDVSEIDDKSFTGYVANLVTMESAKGVPAADKVAFEKDALQLKESYTGAQELTVLTVGKRYPDVKIDWAVEGAGISYENGKLTIAAPTAESTVKVTATFTLGETTDTKEFPITLKPAVATPEANSTLTIPEANALGALFEKDTYSEGKYYVTGVVSNVTNTTYGNLYIKDADGNEFYVYGLYDEAGAKYGEMETKPEVGDTITVWGKIGFYTSAQMKNGTMTAYTKGEGTVTPPAYTTPEEILNALYALTDGQSLSGPFTLTGKITALDSYNNPTIVVEGFEDKPVYCYRLQVENAVGDIITVTAGSMKNYGGTYEFMDCTVVTEGGNQGGGNAGEGEGETPVIPEGAITVSIADYAAANGWENSILYTQVTHADFTATTAGTPVGEYGLNTGKYYTNGNNWRIYQTENATLTITAAEGKTIASVIITYAVKNTGVLLNGEAQVASDEVVTVNANSITFGVGNSSTATNGQVQITAISVVLSEGTVTPPAGGEEGGEGEVETPVEPGCTAHVDADNNYKCDNCEEVVAPAEGEALTITQAIALADALGAGNYTTAKYYMTVMIESVYNTQYGNANVTDASGNKYVIYGLYSADGATRYDKMETKPTTGDEITVYGIVGSYAKNGVVSSYQMKDGWIDEHVAHNHAYVDVVTAPTCTADGYTTHTCSICQDTYTDGETPAVGHTTTNGVCGNCGQEITAENPGLTEKTYSYEFTSSQFSANETKTLNNVDWTIAGDGNYWGFDSNNGRGQQLGSGSAPYKELTVTSASFSNVSKIMINTCGASSIAGKCIVYVGDTQVGQITLTKSATDYSFDVAGLTGEIKLVYTQTSSKAIYIKSIAVNYAE